MVSSIAFDPNTAQFYGAAVDPVSGRGELLAINVGTAAATPVGPFGLSPVNTNATSIAFSNTSALYGYFKTGSQPESLFSINESTGNAALIGSSLIGSTSGDGMAMSPDGKLYFAGKGAAGSLYTLNTSTGQATAVATLSNAPLGSTSQIKGLAFNGAQHHVRHRSAWLDLVRPRHHRSVERQYPVHWSDAAGLDRDRLRARCGRPGAKQLRSHGRHRCCRLVFPTANARAAREEPTMTIDRRENSRPPAMLLTTAAVVCACLMGSSTVYAQAQETLKGHKNTITCLAFSKDGKLLASGAKDGTAIVWNVERRAEVHRFEGHKDMIVSAAFRPDAKLLATSSHDTLIRLWDVPTGEPFGKQPGHEKDVRGLAFSPDGKTLASAGVDHSVRLWEPGDVASLHRLAGHTAEVNCVAFSPDGKLLASGGWDRTVRIWDPVAMKPLHVLEGHTEFVRDLAFAPDGKLFSSGKDGVIRVWDAAAGKMLRTLEGHKGLVRSLSLSRDGKSLASAGRDGTLNLWDVENGKVIATMQEGTLGFQAVAFAPDGRMLATGGIDRNITLWDVDQIRKEFGKSR